VVSNKAKKINWPDLDKSREPTDEGIDKIADALYDNKPETEEEMLQGVSKLDKEIMKKYDLKKEWDNDKSFTKEIFDEFEENPTDNHFPVIKDKPKKETKSGRRSKKSKKLSEELNALGPEAIEKNAFLMEDELFKNAIDLDNLSMEDLNDLSPDSLISDFEKSTGTELPN
jgi:hypothetical protein